MVKKGVLNRILKYKEITYNALENNENKNEISKRINFYLISIILLSVAIGAVTTVKDLHNNYYYLLKAIDSIILLLFIIEYAVRVYVINLSPKFSGKIIGRLRYMLTPMAVLDLLVILLSLFALEQSGFFILRTLRLLKIIRLLQTIAKTDTFSILKKVIAKEKHLLKLIAMFCTTLVLVSSSVIYMLEHSAQPEVFSSIPKAMWWSVVTFTTVGYGDMYPITATGRLLTTFIALIGLASFSIPTTVLTAGFITESRKLKPKKKHENFCPNCGHCLKNE